MNQQNGIAQDSTPRIVTSRLRALALGSALSAVAIAGSAQLAHGEPLAAIDPAALARVDELANAMKHVGKALEPSVVSIEVEKRVPARQRTQMNEDMLKRFFPDADGDGEPDVPPQLRDQFEGKNNDADDATPRPEGRVYGEGSGVILDVKGETAYVLTNNHVAGDASKLKVILSDGREIEDVKVIGTDPLTDLAVLEIKGVDLVGAKWGASEALEKGDIVLAFGAPFNFVGSMTQGIVSALNRSNVGILGQNGYENFIQTDCAINPGNSGGPLVNIHGEVVGINTAIASRTGGFNGVGFAIPSQLAKHVYAQIKETGKVTRGFLGVDIRDATALDKRQSKKLGLAERQQGIYVAGFRNDTPAEGKLEPDDVIISIDGQPVKNSQELRFKVATTSPGTSIKLGIIRSGEKQTIDIAIGTLPEEDAPAVARGERRESTTTPPDVGVTLTDPAPNRLKSAGLTEGTKGALVTAVKAGSPAQLAGVEVNDLIKKVGDKTVNNAAEAAAALKEHKLADGISILIQNKAGTRALFVQVDD